MAGFPGKWAEQAENDVDYILPDMLFEDSAADPQLVQQPMQCMRALAHLRAWCTKATGTPSDLSTHSCKATLLTWGTQAGAPVAWRAAQGTHAYKKEGSMVNKYGRDDVESALLLQRMVSRQARQGKVFTTPVRRGCEAPIEPEPRSLAGPHEWCSEDKSAEKRGNTGLEESSPSEHSASTSESSSSDEEAGPPPKEDGDQANWLVNVTTKVAHLAVPCTEEEDNVMLAGQPWRAACGTRVGNKRHGFELAELCPHGD